MFIDDATAPYLHMAGRLARVSSLLDPEQEDARELLTEIEAILGDSDSRLGNYPTSDAHWDIALDYVGGPRTGDGTTLYQELIKRADTLHQEGQYYTSAIFWRRAASLSTQQLGPTTRTRRHAQRAASSTGDMGRNQEAEPLLKEVLAKQEQKLGHDHPQTFITRGMLAKLYGDMGRYEEAEPLFKKVLAKIEQKLGPDHQGQADHRPQSGQALHGHTGPVRGGRAAPQRGPCQKGAEVRP